MKHWTEEVLSNFRFRVAFDFMEDLQARLDARGLSQAFIAEQRGISQGRVSQLFNNPGNLTLDTMIECARALEMKVTIMAYDDGDEGNLHGPIPSEIFRRCWEECGKPSSMWDFPSVDPESQFDLPAMDQPVIGLSQEGMQYRETSEDTISSNPLELAA